MKKKQNIYCDTCYLTADAWYVTRGMWHMVGGEYSLNISTPYLLRYGIDSVLKILNKRITDWMNQSMNQLMKVLIEQPGYQGSVKDVKPLRSGGMAHG